MRRAVAALLLALVPAAAQDAPATHAGPQLRDGRLKDTFWGLAYEAPGLKKAFANGDAGVVFKGRCEGGIELAIRVHEATEPRPAPTWRKVALEALRRETRPPAGVREGDDPYPWAVWRRTDLAGFEKLAGSSFCARDFHCFEVQAESRATGEEAEEALRRALGGLRLAPEADGTLLVWRLARQGGRHLDDPDLLVEAGYEYVSGQMYRTRNLPMAARVFARARTLMTEETYEPDRLWVLFECGGIALMAPPLRRIEEAMEWHARAEEVAHRLPEDADERAAQSAYNLACACALAGKLDEGFAALHRAYETVRPVDDAHVSGDKDLENLRKDPRWDRFWSECVKGR